MIYPSLISILAVILTQILAFNVSRARCRYGIHPPATTGNPEFERRYRAHMNTVEHLVLFLPSLWFFGLFWATVAPFAHIFDFVGGAPKAAAIIGTIWIIGRIHYSWGYYRDARSRLTGFVVSAICLTVLSGGALVAVLWQIYRLQYS